MKHTLLFLAKEPRLHIISGFCEFKSEIDIDRWFAYVGAFYYFFNGSHTLERFQTFILSRHFDLPLSLGNLLFITL